MASNPSVVKTTFLLPGRNVESLSHKLQFSMRMGEFAPFEHIDLNPYERLEVVPAALVKTLPALAPIMSRARCRIYAFWSPDKNYVSEYLTNRVEENVNLPEFVPYTGGSNFSQAYIDEMAVQPMSLLNCIGFGNGFNPLRLPDAPIQTQKGFAAHRILTYYDVVRNYILDRNMSQFFVSSGLAGSGDTFSAYNVESLDSYFEQRLWEVENISGRKLVSCPWYGFSAHDLTFDYRDIPYNQKAWQPFSNGGLCLKPHMPDLNSAFASTSKYEEAIAKSIVRLVSDEAGNNGVSIQDIIGGAQNYNFYAKVLATGGQMNEMIRAEFGVDVTNDLDIPMFLRQWSFDLGFNDVVSQSASEGEPLGSLAGRGVGALSFAGDSKEAKKRRKKNTLTFRSNMHGTVCFYFSIEPYAEYNQGIDPFLLKTRTLDKFWPSFDRAGWQPLPLYQLIANNEGSGDEIGGTEGVRKWLDTENPFMLQAGVQAAYTEYKAAVSRNFGLMAEDLSYWTFTRRFNTADIYTDGVMETSGSPFNTYVFPGDYNAAFADVSGKNFPFITSIGLDIKIKRPISRVQLETAVV